MIEDIFVTPVYHEMVKDSPIINYHIDKIIDKIDFNMKKQWGATHYLSTDFAPYSHPNVIKEYGLHKLYKEIDKHVQIYCKQIRFLVKPYTMLSWLSKFEKGNYAHIHHHAEADIAGVYYYKTNEKDGDIFFESPNPFLNSTRCYNNQAYSLPPIQGNLLLFPGWLKHGVRTNTTDNIRISLAFNVYFEHQQGT